MSTEVTAGSPEEDQPSEGAPPSPPAEQPVGLTPPPAPRRRRRRWPLVLALVLLLVAGCGATSVVLVSAVRRVAGDVGGSSATASRAAAIQQLLDRRSRAVLGKDERAFMADVGGSADQGQDSALRTAQKQEYENLIKLPLAQFSLKLEADRTYPEGVPRAIRDRYEGRVYAVGVTIHYGLTGIDPVPVAVPWVPIFGFADGHWVIAGLARDDVHSMLVGGQPWSGGPITVTSSDRVVLVRSADDPNPADGLLKLAETSLDRVLAVRRTGWPGKVLVLAVQDSRVFDAYFQDSPDNLISVAAIAVRHETEIPEWRTGGTFAATRIVFNPEEIGAVQDRLRDDLVHEFTHAAMGPVTVRASPTWLVEGFAEYVTQKGTKLSAADIRRGLNGVATDGSLPDNQSFYQDAGNYAASWLACKMIAERYGEAKLIDFYAAFADPKEATIADAVARRVLGVGMGQLTSDWQAYVAKSTR